MEREKKRDKENNGGRNGVKNGVAEEKKTTKEGTERTKKVKADDRKKKTRRKGTIIKVGRCKKGVEVDR